MGRLRVRGIASALRAHAACGAGHLRPARIEAGSSICSGTPLALTLDPDGCCYFNSIHLCRHDTTTASGLDKSVHIEADFSISHLRSNCVSVDRSLLNATETSTRRSPSAGRWIEPSGRTQRGDAVCWSRPPATSLSAGGLPSCSDLQVDDVPFGSFTADPPFR